MFERDLEPIRSDRKEGCRDPAAVASALRERIYATLTGVATMMLLFVRVEQESVASPVVT